MIKQNASRRSRRRASGIAIGALLLILAGFGLVGSASADVGANRSVTAAGANVRRDASTNGYSSSYGIPPLLSTNPYTTSKYGQEFKAVTTAGKPKVTFNFPAIDTLVYLSLCFKMIGFERCGPAAPPANSEIGKALAKYPALPITTTLGYGSAWFQSPKGSARAFGSLPPVKVSALAFGVIPVTATVSITQSLTGGSIDPLTVEFAAAFTPTAKGESIKGFPYGPSPDDLAVANFPAHVSGGIVVGLSNVSIDGQPLPVGNACQARNSSLNVGTPGGWADLGAAPVRGQPGEYEGLSPVPSGYLQGSAHVGSFTGCEADGENVDSLLTSFISGDDNPVNLEVNSGLAQWCTSANTGSPVVGNIDCEAYDDAATAGRVAQHAAATMPRDVIRSLPQALRRRFETPAH